MSSGIIPEPPGGSRLELDSICFAIRIKKDMKKHALLKLRFNTMLVGFAAFPMLVQAQYFNIPANGDLLAGFRKTGAHQGTNELAVYLGNVTNLLGLPLGSTVTMSNVPPARLTDAFSSDYTFLQWSVFGADYDLTTEWPTSFGSFPPATIWYTVPRTNSAVQTIPKARFSKSAQATAGTSIYSIGNGANSISGSLVGGTNANNNAVLVREPFQQAYAQFYLTTFMGDQYNSTIGDLGGAVFNFSIEQTTPSPFDASVRADLYQSAPAPQARPPAVFVDPITGSTSNVYYVGYFELSPTGVLTFTRASAGSNLPPPPVLNIAVSGNTSTISFGTANGATYTLLYTNSSGLSAPRSTWPALGIPITGNGGVTNFTDSASLPDRVYSVAAH